MAVPVLHLNLAPRPSLWRQRHQILGWATLGVGTAFLLGSLGLTWRAYRQANRAGRDAVSLTEEARRAAGQEQRLQASLQDVDASREQARWKVAERILTERSLPWSRVTAELEQCMVPDMRVKGLQRTRGNNQQVVMKLKIEARSRDAEAAFVEALQAAPVFTQVVLERESERQGGGWDLEMSLPAAPIPPPFVTKPIKTAPAGTVTVVASPKAAPAVPGRPLPPMGRPAAAPSPAPQPGPPVRSAPVVQPQPLPPPPSEPGGDEGEEGRRPRRRPGRQRRSAE